MEHQNVGLAFGLSVAAGLATGVGGSIVFWSSIVNHFNTLFLAAALSSSAGVMLWVSFCELLIESTDHFKEGGHSDAGAAGAATACFFAGCLMVNILDQIVHGILHYNDAGAMWTSAEGAPGRGWRNLPAWPAFLARQYVTSVKDWYQEVKAAANSGSNDSDSARGGHHHRHGHGHSHGHGNRQPSTGDHQPVPSASELATGAKAATHAEGDVTVAVRSLAGLRKAANSIGEDASLLVHVGCAPVADTPLTALPVSAGAAACGAGTTAAVGSSPRAGHGPARQGSMAASPTTSTKGANLQRFPSFSDASGSNNNLNYAGNEDGAASLRVDADRERGSGTGSRGDGGRGADATGGAGGSGGTIDSSTGYETLDSTRQPGSTRDHRSGSCDALEPAPASLSRHGSAAAAAGTIALPADTPAWVQEMTEIDEHSHLNKLGLLAAVAIAIHNVPEGVATFVGALAQEQVGFILAFAIGLHNIFEGIAVAVPIYFATRSRSKAFLYAFWSGLAEPLGALIAWGVMWASASPDGSSSSKQISPVMFGCVFGIVSGAMVYISLVELLPTARKYDKNDLVATKGLILGMIAMSMSLVLLAL